MRAWLSAELGEVICIRRLSGQKTTRKRGTAIVRLWKPRKKNRMWVCPFHISGIGLREPVLVYGGDSFQALIMALEGIRVTLKKTDRDLTWVGEPGDSGFPMMVLGGFDLAFTRKLERLVEEETERFGRTAEDAYNTQLRKQGGP